MVKAKKQPLPMRKSQRLHNKQRDMKRKHFPTHRTAHVIPPDFVWTPCLIVDWINYWQHRYPLGEQIPIEAKNVKTSFDPVTFQHQHQIRIPNLCLIMVRQFDFGHAMRFYVKYVDGRQTRVYQITENFEGQMKALTDLFLGIHRHANRAI